MSNAMEQYTADQQAEQEQARKIINDSRFWTARICTEDGASYTVISRMVFVVAVRHDGVVLEGRDAYIDPDDGRLVIIRKDGRPKLTRNAVTHVFLLEN